MSTEFKPDWCLAPAALLREWMRDNGLSIRVLSVNGRTGEVTKDDAVLRITQVLDREPLTEAHAETLGRCTSIPARFWLNYEHNYRAGLAAGLKDVTPEDSDA